MYLAGVLQKNSLPFTSKSTKQYGFIAIFGSSIPKTSANHGFYQACLDRFETGWCRNPLQNQHGCMQTTIDNLCFAKVFGLVGLGMGKCRKP